MWEEHSDINVHPCTSSAKDKGYLDDDKFYELLSNGCCPKAGQQPMNMRRSSFKKE
jgi:hypothetical protein